MIIEVALGVVLGVLILAFWRELIALGVLVVVAGVVLVVLGFGAYFLYEALQSAKMSPIWQAATSTITLIAGIGLYVMFAFAVGHVLEQRTKLRRREASVLGAALFVLFMVSAITVEWMLQEQSTTNPQSPILLTGALLVAWATLLFECRRRIRRRRLDPSKPQEMPPSLG